MDSDREELFKVCVSHVLVPSLANDRRKHLYNEVTVWKQLSHRNVLPFLGVSLKQFTPSFCIISPWMDNGHVVSFLKRNPDHDRYAVVRNCAVQCFDLVNADCLVIALYPDIRYC